MARSKAHSIVGDSGGNRAELDFYPTPAYATEALMSREKFEGRVWEPAAGAGDMSQVIEKYNFNVLSTDIKYRGFGSEKSVDFINTDFYPDLIENVITNPPFKYAKEFVLTAKKVATKKIAMFLKLVFLEGQRRQEMLMDTEFPLARIYVFSKRVNLYRETLDGKGKSGGMIAFAWFVWDKSYSGKPTVDWI
jgi:hypothetical protein